MKLILASGSRQRSEILTKLGLDFTVVVPGVDELTGGDPEIEVVENARSKAYTASRAGGAVGGTAPEDALATAGGGGSPTATGPARQAHGPARLHPARHVLACDTDVVLDGKALGKPADEREAREYLDRMSGRAHTVMSGLVVLVGDEARSGLERTTVVFKELTDAEKDRYVRFGEWRGRSGGYAIQTLGSTLVERVEGSVSNVVGLPVGLLIELVPELLEQGSAA